MQVNWKFGISFSGSEGSGKTTLINAIAEKLQVPKTVNFVRNAMKEMGLTTPPAFDTDKELTKKFQRELLLKRGIHEKYLQSPFLADRSSVDMFAYTLSHLAREADMQFFLDDYFGDCIAYARLMYEFHFFIPSGRIPLVHDGLRNTLRHNARLMHYIILGILQDQALPFHIIQSTTLKDRIEEVLTVMRANGFIK